MSTLKTVDFHGDQLQVVSALESHWVVVRRVCESLGIDADSQRKRLQDQERSPWAVTVITTATGPDGKDYKAFCVDLDSLPMWLANIDASRVRPEAKGKLLKYQRECARVLRDHLFGVPAALVRSAEPDFEDSTAMLAKALEIQSRKALALQGEVEAARPKVEVYDRIIDSGDTVGFRQACKLIFAGTGAKEHEVREFLLRARWIQRLGGRLAPASYGQQNGYVTSRDRELPNVTNIDGGPMVVPELRITQRGVARAVDRINSERAA